MNIDIDLGYQGNVVVFDLDDTLYKECDYVASAYNAIDKYMSEHYNIQSKECFATMENAFKNKANPFDKLFEMLSAHYLCYPGQVSLLSEHLLLGLKNSNDTYLMGC